MSNLNPATTGPHGDQEIPEPQDLEQLLDDLNNNVSSSGTCNHIKKKVAHKLAEELVDKRVRILIAAIKAYRDRQEQYKKSDKPTGIFYTKENGKFVEVKQYNEELVKRLTAHREIIEKIKTSVNNCLLPEATGKAFDALAAILKEYDIVV